MLGKMAILVISENYITDVISANLICPPDSGRIKSYSKEDIKEMTKDVAVGVSGNMHMVERHLAIVNWHLDHGFTFLAPGIKRSGDGMIATRIYMRTPVKPDVEVKL